MSATDLSRYDRWLHKTAYDLLPAGSPHHDDLVQEGRIAMWRALETYDPTKGTLAPWLTGAARLRMRDVAHGKGRPTGHEAARGRRSVESVGIDPTDPESGVPEPSYEFEVDPLMTEAVRAALLELPSAQMEYVITRFWLGVDPSSRSPETRQIVEDYPILRKSHLWKRARANLRESLADHQP